eukprot:SAG11_NODE_674_length_7801_cov_3.578032_3_plen_192_part_00
MHVKRLQWEKICCHEIEGGDVVCCHFSMAKEMLPRLQQNPQNITSASNSSLTFQVHSESDDEPDHRRLQTEQPTCDLQASVTSIQQACCDLSDDAVGCKNSPGNLLLPSLPGNLCHIVCAAAFRAFMRDCEDVIKHNHSDRYEEYGACHRPIHVQHNHRHCNDCLLNTLMVSILQHDSMRSAMNEPTLPQS